MSNTGTFTTFTVLSSDLQEFIKGLDVMEENINKSVRKSMHSAAKMIMQEQKRLAPNQKLADAITASGVYTTKKGEIRISTGYNESAFEKEVDGFNLGIMGTMYEFGRPGQSRTRNDKYRYWHYTNKNGKTVHRKDLKGTINAVPHIRRGYDNKIEQAVQAVIDGVMEEIEKTLE